MIDAGLRFRIREAEYAMLADRVVFVAVKNGDQAGTGSFLHVGSPKAEVCFPNIPLTEIPQRIMSPCVLLPELVSPVFVGSAGATIEPRSAVDARASKWRRKKQAREG